MPKSSFPPTFRAARGLVPTFVLLPPPPFRADAPRLPPPALPADLRDDFDFDFDEDDDDEREAARVGVRRLDVDDLERAGDDDDDRFVVDFLPEDRDRDGEEADALRVVFLVGLPDFLPDLPADLPPDLREAMRDSFVRAGAGVRAPRRCAPKVATARQLSPRRKSA